MIKTACPNTGVWLRSLFRELRPCMPLGVWSKTQIKIETQISFKKINNKENIVLLISQVLYACIIFLKMQNALKFLLHVMSLGVLYQLFSLQVAVTIYGT